MSQGMKAFFPHVGPEKQPSFLAAMRALGALRPLLLVDSEMLQRWLTGEEEAEDED
jgi:hypothetical protein